MGKELLKVNAGRQRQRFSKEFKLNAIKLLQAGQKPATQLALLSHCMLKLGAYSSAGRRITRR